MKAAESLVPAGHRPLLVVFDALGHPGPLIRLLPELKGVRLLVTSRQDEWPEDLDPPYRIGLGPLARPESLALLRRLAPTLKDCSDWELEQAANEQRDLPFWLACTAAYLGCTVHSLTAYLGQLQAYSSQEGGDGRGQPCRPADQWGWRVSGPAGWWGAALLELVWHRRSSVSVHELRFP
jgi:hypothetical protein